MQTAAATTRDHSGRFRPGCSGNPQGRPRSVVRDRLRAALLEFDAAEDGTERTRAERLVQVVFGILFDESASARDRLRAAEWITEQADGRLPHPVEALEPEAGGITIKFAAVEA
jgi:hypothetical protein